MYSALLAKWKAHLSGVLQREVANCIIVGGQNARGGDRISAAVPDSQFAEFEAVRPRM